ncbi:MAG: ATP-binding cassette domain-containing protein [Spirochaetaceae bacterium]|nr:MAG: ATP-binding cassette domain-containing protein [Spirochaetaceae bacterium]
MSAIIRLEQLSKSFDSLDVLRGISLDFESKEITSIIGQSGTGKSVLFKCMIGIMAPDEGRVFYKGKDLVEMSEEEKELVQRNFGYAFQDAALFDSMSVAENIAFPLREVLGIRNRREIRQRVREMLEWIELPDIGDKNPSELSGGMRKRVGVARALAIKPEILLFDEPTSGLDPVLGQTINDLVVRVNRELELTCILITHDIPAAFRISDKVAFLHQGEVIAQGPPREVIRSEHDMVRQFVENSFSSQEV